VQKQLNEHQAQPCHQPTDQTATAASNLLPNFLYNKLIPINFNHFPHANRACAPEPLGAAVSPSLCPLSDKICWIGGIIVI